VFIKEGSRHNEKRGGWDELQGKKITDGKKVRAHRQGGGKNVRELLPEKSLEGKKRNLRTTRKTNSV